VLLVLVLLLTALVQALPARADDEQDIRALLGGDVAAMQISEGWALVDVGIPGTSSMEQVVLRRYKGHWRRITTPSSLSRGEVLALGMSSTVANELGLGEPPDDSISALQTAMQKAGLTHGKFNIASFRGGFLALTTNDVHDGFHIWAWNGRTWKPFFAVEPKASGAVINKAFDDHGIPRYIEYRLLFGRGGSH